MHAHPPPPPSPTTTTTTEIIPAPLAKVIVKSEGICQKSSSTLDEDLTRLGETKLEEKEARAGPKVRGHLSAVLGFNSQHYCDDPDNNKDYDEDEDEYK
ncbi:unnamed protein product [Arctogadus glacialis]